MRGSLKGSIVLSEDQAKKICDSDLKSLCTLNIEGEEYKFMFQKICLNSTTSELPFHPVGTKSTGIELVQITIPQAVIDMKFRTDN